MVNSHEEIMRNIRWYIQQSASTVRVPDDFIIQQTVVTVSDCIRQFLLSQSRVKVLDRAANLRLSSSAHYSDTHNLASQHAWHIEQTYFNLYHGLQDHVHFTFKVTAQDLEFRCEQQEWFFNYRLNPSSNPTPLNDLSW